MMSCGERARAGARPVEKHARDNSETPEPVTHQVNHDPPVQGVITESAGNTFNTVISWLQGRVRGNPSRTDSKVSNLTLGSGSRLKEVLGTQFGRPSKNIEGSRSLTIESDDQASDCSKSIFRPARKSSSKRQPETNISSYVILPVRRPKTASRKDREHKKLLLHRDFGKSKEPFYSENDVDCERGNDFSGSQPNSQGTIAGNGGNHWDLNYGRRPQPIRIDPLLDHVAEIRRMEDSVRQKWFNPEMEKEVLRREHDKSSLSNTTTPTDEHATSRSHRADEGAGQNAPTVVASPFAGGRSTKADEERRANAWLTEIILEGILADIGRELGSLCDEFVEHICSCEFLTDDE